MESYQNLDRSGDSCSARVLGATLAPRLLAPIMRNQFHTHLHADHAFYRHTNFLCFTAWLHPAARCRCPPDSRHTNARSTFNEKRTYKAQGAGVLGAYFLEDTLCSRRHPWHALLRKMGMVLHRINECRDLSELVRFASRVVCIPNDAMRQVACRVIASSLVDFLLPCGGSHPFLSFV